MPRPCQTNREPTTLELVTLNQQLRVRLANQHNRTKVWGQKPFSCAEHTSIYDFKIIIHVFRLLRSFKHFFLVNESKCFSGWPKRYVSCNNILLHISPRLTINEAFVVALQLLHCPGKYPNRKWFDLKQNHCYILSDTVPWRLLCISVNCYSLNSCSVHFNWGQLAGAVVQFSILHNMYFIPHDESSSLKLFMCTYKFIRNETWALLTMLHSGYFDPVNIIVYNKSK